MPRVATASKQKNRPFKRSGKASRKANTTQKSKSSAAPKSKAIHKLSKADRIQQAKLSKARQAEKLAAANEYLDAHTKGSVAERIKSQNEIRIVLLVPCNEQADVAALMNAVHTYSLAQNTFVVNSALKACLAYPAFQLLPGPARSPIKNRLFIIGTDRDPAKLIDLAKCADIVCPVVSALAANPQRITEDPFGNAGTFDEAGYATVNLLRSIGVSRVVGLIQHLDAVEHKHRDKVEKFYRRFLQSEFGDEKCLNAGMEEAGPLLRVLDSVGVTPAAWKAHRGYLLPDQIETSPEGNLVLSGFLKGNCISPNQIAHLTGLGEFHIEKIEIQSVGKSRNNSMAEELVQFATSPDEMEEFAKPETHQDEEDILTALNGLQIEQPVEEPREEGMEDEDESEDDEADWEDQEEMEDNRAEEKARRMEMHMRQDEELEFEDEVEYAAEEILREKYREYQGLKSFKSSGWNQLENLPHQYDRIYFFKRYSQTQQAALRDNLARGFAYPGFYVRITLVGIKAEAAAAYASKLPLVVSFLLKHERKMTVLHGKVKRNPFYEGSAAVESGKMVMVSIGFKRLVVSPLYSRCINGTEKTKSTKEVGEDYDNHYFCSFYGHNTFPPSPFLVFRVNPLFPSQIEGAPVMRGELVKCDPMHVVLERIILTGYPFKINRRRSTVRYMFFNPQDVKYFRPVEVRTKMGLRVIS